MSTTTSIRTECPRPDKRKLTQAEAEEHVKKARYTLHPDIRAYQCKCGAWHVGKSAAAFSSRVKFAVGSGNHKMQHENRRNSRRGRR
jgi:hypothetical protein